ncbi:MAG: hypothetical protein QOJ00_1803 [Actinomycetota bacterium]
MVARGELVQFSYRAYAVAGSPETSERWAMAALLDAPVGSALSFYSSAAVYKTPGFTLEPIHISVPRQRRSQKGGLADVVHHHPRFFPESHLVVVNGLVVTIPSRTGADLAHLRSIHPKRAERAVDSMWAAGLTDRRKLTRMESEWCERGRRGSVFLHDYLEARPIEWKPAESSLERRFIEIIVGAGFPSPRSQVDLGDDEQWFGRTDLVDPELPLIAEIDSDRFHTAPLDKAADKKRDESAARAGFEVERFTEREVWHEADKVTARWAAARRRVHRRRVG